MIDKLDVDAAFAEITALVERQDAPPDVWSGQVLRQGDVIVVPTAEPLPRTAKTLPPGATATVVGTERGGHGHRLQVVSGLILWDHAPTAGRRAPWADRGHVGHLQVEGVVRLEPLEPGGHDPLLVGRGRYLLRRQVELAPRLRGEQTAWISRALRKD